MAADLGTPAETIPTTIDFVINPLRRLKGRSFAELGLRGLQAISARVERVRLQVNLPSFPHFERAQPLEARSLLDGVLDRARSDCARRTAAALAADDQAMIMSLRSRATDICLGRIALMGVGPLFLGNPPDWHREGQSGVVVPRLHWSRISYLDPSAVGDHKILWEVNRHQYLLALALLWNIDGRTEDFGLVQTHLSSWLDNNPTSVGVNWCSSLEVGYRAITWCWLLSLLPKPLWKAEVRERLIEALEQHGRHIERYLSYYFSPNTHLTGEALALLYIGHVVPKSRFAHRWRELGARILESWLPRQVYGDGVYFEQSTQYQRYTAEIYLHYLRIAESNESATAATIRASLSRQFDVLRALAAGNGEMPLIGDDDGGALFPIDQQSPQDLRGLLLAGATALNRPELVPPGRAQPAMSYWLCGVEGTRKMLAASDHTPGFGTRYFANGGIAVIRDSWQVDSAVAVIDAGRHGKLNCGHAHADALSCTLALGEQPLFVDRGTLTYMGPERNEYRSSVSHNALEFDGESAVEPLGPFEWGPRPPRPTATVRLCSEMALFRGTAWGHAGTARPSTHSRVIAHAPGGAWAIFDRGIRSERSRVILRWQLAAGLMVASGSDPFEVKNATGDTIAHVTFPLASSVHAGTRDISMRYGQKSAAIVLEAVTDEHFRAVSLVLPATCLPNIRPMRVNADTESNSPRTFPWNDRLGDHLIALPKSPGATFRVEGWEADADLVWCIKRSSCWTDSASQPDLVVAIAARRLVPPGSAPVLDVGANPPEDLVIRKTSGSWTILPLDNPQVGQEHD